MNEFSLRLSNDIYKLELERLSRVYLSLVDSIVQFEGELDGDINTKYNQSVLYELKYIAKRIPKFKDIFENFRKRIYFLEVRGVFTYESHPGVNEEDEVLIKVYKSYLDVVTLIDSYSKSVYEIELSSDILDMVENPSFFECDTLVGALRNPRQFGVCLKRKFYHIPAKYIEEYAIPKYVAIYQSERFFGEELAGVKYYGEVKKCVPLKRSRIRELPRKSDELYYKFKVKKWQRLETPINAKEIGFIRLFTSFSLLCNSCEIPELTLLDKDAFLLYHSIKTSLKELATNVELMFVGFRFPEFEIIISKETVYLCKEEKLCEQYRCSNFLTSPANFVEKIKGGMKKHS